MHIILFFASKISKNFFSDLLTFASILDVWKRENHPINEISESIEGMIAIKKIFRQNSNFYDSQDHWEIRLADIVGTILHRYQNRGVCEHIAKKSSWKSRRGEK